MKRLIFLDEYANAKNDDRATQQLRLLADVVAYWINEIIIEVDKIYRETLKEYSEKRWIRMLEVNDNDNETKIKLWKQIEQIKEKNNQEEKNEIIKRNNLTKKRTEEKQKEKNKEDQMKKEAQEGEQLDDGKVKNENVRNKTIEKKTEKQKE